MVLVGFGVAFIALLASAEGKGSKVKGGGVIMIGPIPIVFGSDSKWASVAIALAIVLIALSILFYVIQK
jgi:uncharacterized protein (TIGR00304 family)